MQGWIVDIWGERLNRQRCRSRFLRPADLANSALVPAEAWVLIHGRVFDLARLPAASPLRPLAAHVGQDATSTFEALIAAGLEQREALRQLVGCYLGEFRHEDQVLPLCEVGLSLYELQRLLAVYLAKQYAWRYSGGDVGAPAQSAELARTQLPQELYANGIAAGVSRGAFLDALVRAPERCSLAEQFLALMHRQMKGSGLLIPIKYSTEHPLELVTRTLLAALLRHLDLVFLAQEVTELRRCDSSDAEVDSAEEEEEKDEEEEGRGGEQIGPPRRTALPPAFTEIAKCLASVRRELVHRHQVTYFLWSH